MSIVERAGATVTALVEREDALAALHGALAESRAGSGRLLLVPGEAGVGKSALVAAFSTAARGARVLVGCCDPLFVPRPLGPFHDVVGARSDSFANRLRSARSAADAYLALREELEDSATVLVVEDIHWADEATLDVIRLLARRIDEIPALVVLTYRDDALERAHPLHMVLGELAGSRGVERVRVPRLSPDGVRALASMSGADPERLYEITSGNAFFVTEVLAGGSAELPETVRAAVLARTRRVEQSVREVLETLAVAPPSLDAVVLERIPEISDEAVEAGLAAGVLVTAGDGVAFRHDIARIVVEEELSPLRRRALHRRILIAGGSCLDVARLAHHAEEAADAEAVLALAPEAGRRAAEAGAYREAAAQYARALRFAADLPPRDRAVLLESRSRACYLADDQVEAIEVISEAVACRRAEAAPAQEARALAELSSYLLCRGRYSESKAAVAEALQLIAGLPESAEVAAVLNAQAELSWDDRSRQLELARTAVAVAEGCGAERVAADARITLAEAQMCVDFETGRESLELIVAECRAAGQAEQAARALSGLGQLSSWAERPDEAAAHLRAALEHCEEHTLDLWRIHVLAVSAIVALEQGRWTDAADFSTRLLEDPRESPWPHVAALLVLALVRARRGDPDSHLPLEEALRLDIPHEEVEAIVDRAAAQAEIAWLERRVAEVDPATAATLDAAVERGDTAAICRLSYWRHVAGLAVELPPDAEGPLALGLAGAWEEAAAEWTRRGRPYEAALALAETGDEALLRQAHDQLRQLGALPAAAAGRAPPARARRARAGTRTADGHAREPRRSDDP